MRGPVSHVAAASSLRSVQSQAFSRTKGLKEVPKVLHGLISSKSVTALVTSYTATRADVTTCCQPVANDLLLAAAAELS